MRSQFDPGLRHRDDLSWLFVLTLPNSGSTALAKFLLTAPGVVALTKEAEGQWLVPAMSSDGRRWQRNHPVDWRMVRAVWLDRLRRTGKAPRLVIEKSPPSMCRWQPMLDAFSTMPCTMVTCTRNPYAVIASWMKRYRPARVAREWLPGSATPTDETEFMALLASVWIDRAEMLTQAATHAAVTINYESFADNPHDTVDRLAQHLPILKQVDHEAGITVKDYAPQAIRNMNAEQIALLSAAHRESIRAVLAERGDLVEALGYRVDPPD